MMRAVGMAEAPGVRRIPGKRLFDVVCSLAGLVLLSPVMAAAALAIRLSSPGPVLYRARRMGRGGRPFTMHKFRTMRHGAGGSAITAAGDARVYPLGMWLRKLKVDELPQLYDVLRGEMSIVGPRPEDPAIVERHYTALGWETLQVAPGLSSPGSLHYYAVGEDTLPAGDPEEAYVRELMPLKLALDAVYVRRASVPYDVAIILRTVWTILCIACGRRQLPEIPELAQARKLLN